MDAGYSGYMTKPIDIDRLLEGLAKELGGKALADDAEAVDAEAVEVEAVEVELGPDTEAPPAAILHSEPPLFSSLPTANPKFRAIVGRFIARLAEQMSALEQAWQAKDFETIADLAHWLKGSAGSVGFADFTEPAQELEAAAKANVEADVEPLILALGQLAARIQLDEADADVSGDTGAEEDNPEPASKAYPMPATVTSRLPMAKDKFRKIVLAFVDRLEQQVVAMRRAYETQDYEELANLGHWLKGSAGSVGFDVFGEPAIDLELYAREQQDAPLRVALEAIEELTRRISVAEDIH